MSPPSPAIHAHAGEHDGWVIKIMDNGFFFFHGLVATLLFPLRARTQVQPSHHILQLVDLDLTLLSESATPDAILDLQEIVVAGNMSTPPVAPMPSLPHLVCVLAWAVDLAQSHGQPRPFKIVWKSAGSIQPPVERKQQNNSRVDWFDAEIELRLLVLQQWSSVVSGCSDPCQPKLTKHTSSS